MSGDCDKCNEHAPECICKPLCQCQQNAQRDVMEWIIYLYTLN